MEQGSTQGGRAIGRGEIEFAHYFHPANRQGPLNGFYATGCLQQRTVMYHSRAHLAEYPGSTKVDGLIPSMEKRIMG